MFWKKSSRDEAAGRSSPAAGQLAEVKQLEASRPASDNTAGLSPAAAATLRALAEDRPQLLTAKKPQPSDDARLAAEGALVPREEILVDTQSLINSFSNQAHIKIDYLASFAAYGFGSAMHVMGQGTALSTLSMWVAGSCFLMTSQQRWALGPTTDALHFEAMASWIWMLSSFQQFKQHKVLRVCGYSSWSGLGLATYFSGKYLLQALAQG